jgi:hypothetical protein
MVGGPKKHTLGPSGQSISAGLSWARYITPDLLVIRKREGVAAQPAVKDGALGLLPGDARVLSPLNLTGNSVNDAREKHLSFASARRASRLSHDV